ncbi:MAG: biopolymer transporter ExbD [Deltaproteobacteria bacterium]|nr:biopolymer transporter ExbD [Candidatus Zymogenaceae bacterium]
MNFSRKTRGKEPPVVNLTSLIDVVLLLLIFFMISTTFILSPGLKVDLPESSAEDITQEEKDIIVVVTVDDEIFIGEDRMDGESLMKRLREFKDENPDSNLIIQADEGASHGAVVVVMDSAKRTGFSMLSIATVKHAE